MSRDAAEHSHDDPEGRLSWFERNPVKTGVGLVVVFCVALLMLTEWLLTPSRDKAESKGLAQTLAPPRFLMMREWRPNSVYSFHSPKARYNDPIGPVDDVYTASIDSNGFIEPSVRHAAPDLEIAFVGGSTTECLYLRPDDRFPARVGRLLEERTGLKINSLNAGKSANNTMHSLVNYIGKVAQRRPRYSVLMHAVNDMAILKTHRTYWHRYKRKALVHQRDRGFEQMRRDFWANTIPYTYTALRQGFLVLKFKVSSLFASARPDDRPAPGARTDAPVDRGAVRKKDNPPPPGEQEVRQREAFRRYFEPALRTFVRTARAWQSRPVLMTQVLVDENVGRPGAAEGDMLGAEQLRRGEFDRTSFGSFHAYANAIVRHVAHSEKVLLIEVAAARRWSGEDVYDGIHFTATGARRMAEIIADALEADIKRAADDDRTSLRSNAPEGAARSLQ